MKIKKITLHKWMLAYDNIADYITDVWFEWKHKQEFGHYRWEVRDDRWMDLLRNMPEMFEWSIEDNHVEIRGMTKEGKHITEKVPLSDFITENGDEPDLEMLWHCNFWDGPLNGVALYNGDVVWFECVIDHGMGDEDEQDDYPLWGLREFAIYELTEEQKMHAVFNHILFREMVGSNSDHKPEFHSWFTRGENFEFFYNDLKECQKKHAHLWDIDYTKGKKLGVFADHEFKNYVRPRRVECASNNEDNQTE